jgi:hypothetical protein
MKLKQLTITILTFCVAAFSGTKAASAASFSVIADGLYNAMLQRRESGEMALVFHQQVVKVILYAMAQVGQLAKLRMVKPSAYLQDYLL